MKKVIFSVLALSLLVISGCSGNTDKKESTKKQSDKSTFTYAINGDPNSMNPVNVGDRWGLTTINMIFSPLVRIEGDGSHKNELAESLTPSEDGKELLVKLRQDVKWSDGEALTADDVVFTYNQKVKKENGGADALWIGDEPIQTEKVDDYTVSFKLPSVSAAAINNIATETYIMPEHLYKDIADFSGTDLKADLVGTGPYKLIKYKRGEYLQFEANEHYYGGKPSVKNVTLRIIPSADTTKVALKNGEVDASYIFPSDIEEIEKAGLNVHSYSENRVGYMGINLNSDKLKDVKVRQAIFYGINKDELNKGAYLDKEYYNNAYSILPPNNPFYSDDVEKYDVDEEKAKSLLKEAGVSDLTLNLGFASDNVDQTLQATLIQQQLQNVGITVELAGGDGVALSTEIQKPDTKKYDLFLNGYIMGNDPDLYSSLFATGKSFNFFHYSNPTVDELFDKGAVELDEAKRADIYAELQKEIAADAVFYPIVDNKKILAVNERVSGIEEVGLVPIYTFEDLSKLTIK